MAKVTMIVKKDDETLGTYKVDHVPRVDDHIVLNVESIRVLRVVWPLEVQGTRIGNTQTVFVFV